MKNEGVYKFSREFDKKNKLVSVGGVTVHESEIVIAAGPCSVESEEQIFEIAKGVVKEGAAILRGGAFKPRTSPYSFQGLGIKGLEILQNVSKKFNIPIVTELMDTELIELYSKKVDLIQVGARNAQNFDMLKKLGMQKKPVLLKNGLGTTVDEWLMSSEYLLSNGNDDVILCYRGARSIESSTRFSMDIGSIAVAKARSRLPIAVDPSHAAGKREYVKEFALAAIAAGA
ncbi:MAG: 3-deoxy-7-phosphoheptulonate synthase, partial [Candidatus Micrarchaeia archaeon]